MKRRRPDQAEIEIAVAAARFAERQLRGAITVLNEAGHRAAESVTAFSDAALFTRMNDPRNEDGEPEPDLMAAFAASDLASEMLAELVANHPRR